MTTLEIFRDGALVHGQTLSARGVRIGRAADNDLCIPEATVSSYHVLLFVREGEVRVRDLNSTNGTFIDGAQLEQNGVLAEDQELRLGPEVRLLVCLSEEEDIDRGPRAYVLDMGSGRLLPLPGGRQSLNELVTDRELPEAVELEVEGETVVVYRAGSQRTVKLGEVLQVGEEDFRLLDVAGAITRTVNAGASQRWHLRVDLSGRPGPVAELTEPGGRASHSIRAANRVSVLYMLAQQMLEDINSEVPTSDAGWCPDENLMRGVWGRRWEDKGSASFQVLIHRVRKDLQKYGLSAESIEKRSGYTRFKPGVFELAPIE